MPVGKIAAQVAHASMGVFFQNTELATEPEHALSSFHQYTYHMHMNKEMHEWKEGIFTKIVVGCDSEQELLDLVAKAKETWGIPHCLITDNGLTCFDNVPTITCAAFGPCDPEKLNALTGHLKLLR